MSRKLAEEERLLVLNTLARDYDVHHYAGSHEGLTAVLCHPAVDYYTDMVRVFFASRINLNLTMPSIETGVPQRVFDIAASGGFVMTNRQEELAELFEPVKEVETFESLDELQDKCTYYLHHERERLQIALAGCKAACERHTYEQRLTELLGMLPNPS